MAAPEGNRIESDHAALGQILRNDPVQSESGE